MAIVHAATAPVTRTSGQGIAHDRLRLPAAAALLRFAPGTRLTLAALALFLAGSPALAASNKVRITKLSDVAFGTIPNLAVDAARSQDVCVYADTASNGYNITAMGTGPGGAFQLSAGVSAMAYEVQWSSASGQSTGVQLTPNVPLTGQISTATHQSCNNGPTTSASLVIVLRSAALSSATAGSYSGSLTIVVGPE